MLRDTETAEAGEHPTGRDAAAAVAATPPTITEGVSGIRFEIGPDGTVTAEQPGSRRSEEHTSELQSLMRSSYAVFCLKQKIIRHRHQLNLRSAQNISY